MSFEYALACLGLLTLIVIGTEIMYTYATQGFGFGFSANRPGVEKSALGLRIQRVYQNQVESAAYIVPVLVAGALFGLQGSNVETAALLIVVGRAAFCGLYYTGIPFVRVPAFALGSFPTLYILVLLFMSPAA